MAHNQARARPREVPSRHRREPNVRFGSLVDICSANRHVRFTPKSGHGVAPSEPTSFAIAAMASGRGPGEDRVRPHCVPQLRPGSLPTLAVCAVLGLFAACVQRL